MPTKPFTTPLRAERRGPGVYLIDAIGFNVAVAQADPIHVEQIVRAVNAYDDLLNACREILRADEYTPDWHVTDAIELAKAAIAKATT